MNNKIIYVIFGDFSKNYSKFFLINKYFIIFYIFGVLFFNMYKSFFIVNNKV